MENGKYNSKSTHLGEMGKQGGLIDDKHHVNLKETQKLPL